MDRHVKKEKSVIHTTKRKRTDPKALGFTLIEIMVVVIVIGVLAALVVPNFLGRAAKAKKAVAQQKIGNIETAINLFYQDYSRFPETLEELVSKPADITEEQWTPPSLKAKDLKDPWGNPFVYRYPGDHGAYDLYSTGADGQEGGEGDNKDINNWE